MANDISKKIAVDVDINTDGQQKIDQYKAAFDSLRSSISGLGKSTADFSKNISSISKDISQLTAATEKTAAKILALSNQLSDQQTKAIAASSQALKTSLSDADKLQEQAFVKELQTKSKTYGMLAVTESNQYAAQKKKLDNFFSQQGSDQQLYQKEAQQLLQQHYDKLMQITDQYIKDTDSQKDNAIKGDTGFFKSIGNGFKKLFSSAIGYYKHTSNSAKKTASDSAKASVDSAKAATDKIAETTVSTAKSTADKVAAITTTALDKKLSSSIDNAKKISDSVFSIMSASVNSERDYKVAVLEKQKTAELNNASLTAAQKQAVTLKYQTSENAIKVKAFKQNQKASIAQAIINGAIAVTKAEADLGPVAGTIALGAIIAQTAAQVVTITKQQPPALAKGGYFRSDGKGAILSGYSRTDDTNAYLRSGEAVVVSEAMQVPWARNLVSAINVGFGGRDFSIKNAGRGYAVGGIFTDGGDANRYYNQPVNDQKNLANTIAYQMINNFPPVYVDVKDVNNQQNILAQTINRVNL